MLVAKFEPVGQLPSLFWIIANPGSPAWLCTFQSSNQLLQKQKVRTNWFTFFLSVTNYRICNAFSLHNAKKLVHNPSFILNAHLRSTCFLPGWKRSTCFEGFFFSAGVLWVNWWGSRSIYHWKNVPTHLPKQRMVLKCSTDLELTSRHADWSGAGARRREVLSWGVDCWSHYSNKCSKSVVYKHCNCTPGFVALCLSVLLCWGWLYTQVPTVVY